MMHALAIGAQRLATRRKNAHVWCATQDRFRQGCHLVQNMLAVVEQNEERLVVQKREQARQGVIDQGSDPECRS